MKKTCLYEKHVEANAKIVDFAGWQMPIQYNNLKEEVLEVRNNVGVFDVSHMGEFFVTGKEANEFVDYLVTNDIKNSKIGKAIYSPLCNDQGTIIDDLIVYKLSDNQIMICVNAANIEKDFSWIKEQSNKFDVKLEDRSQEYSLLAIQGPNSFKVLQQLNILAKPIDDIEYYSVQFDDLNLETPTIIARTGYTGEDGFEIFADHSKIKSIWESLQKLNVKPCGLGARDVLRLEVCYPLYGNELDDTVTPLDCGLKWTVKLDKEDFIGKKALIDYTPKYQLIKIKMDKGVPRAGYEIEENQKRIGKVTSGTMSVTNEYGIGLARIEKDKFNDNELFVNIRGRKYSATRVKKAFVTGGHK